MTFKLHAQKAQPRKSLNKGRVLTYDRECPLAEPHRAEYCPSDLFRLFSVYSELRDENLTFSKNVAFEFDEETRFLYAFYVYWKHYVSDSFYP